MKYSEDEKVQMMGAIFDMICAGESLRTSLSILGPDASTFFKWLNADETGEFAQRYARATTIRADLLFDEALQIADTPAEGTIQETTVDELGMTTTKVKTADMIQHRRLQYDARRWYIGKINPKKYGEAQLLKLGDNEGDKLKPNAIFSADLLILPEDQEQSAEEDLNED